MPWIKLDDGFYDHPKLMRVTGPAAWLWMSCLGYAARHLTDGFVPLPVVEQLGARLGNPKKLAADLVAVGLFRVADGGYQIHDFSVYNPPAANVRAERERKARNTADYRQRKGKRRAVTEPVTGDARGDTMGIVAASVTGDANGHVTGTVTGDKPRPVPVPVPVPRECESTHAQKRASDPEVIAIRDRIRHWPIFASLNAERLADEQGGWMMSAGQKLAWVLASIDEAATQCADGKTYDAMHKMLVSYMHHARKPRGNTDTEPAKVIEPRDDPAGLEAAKLDAEARRKKYAKDPT